MKTKSWRLLFVVGMLMFSGYAVAADSVSEVLGVETNISGTIVIQGTSVTSGTSTDKSEIESPMSNVYNLEFVKKLANGSKFKMHLKGGFGRSLNDLVNTYGTINSNGGNGDNVPKLTELYYQRALFDDKLTVDFGISDFGFAKNRFAGSSDSQFITGAFSGDKVLNSVSGCLALRLAFAFCDELDLMCACFASNTDRAHEGMVCAAEFNIKPVKNGNYRLYGWLNGEKNHHKFKDDGRELSRSYGLGLSIDQDLSNYFGVFARIGYKLSSASGAWDNGNDKFKFPLSFSWSTGFQMKGSVYGREGDVIGVAGGQIYGSSNADAKMAIKNQNNGVEYKNNPETHLELYYKCALNSHIAITPSVQYFIKPRGGNVANDGKNVFIVGIRTSFNL